MRTHREITVVVAASHSSQPKIFPAIASEDLPTQKRLPRYNSNSVCLLTGPFLDFEMERAHPAAAAAAGSLPSTGPGRTPMTTFNCYCRYVPGICYFSAGTVKPIVVSRGGAQHDDGEW